MPDAERETSLVRRRLEADPRNGEWLTDSETEAEECDEHEENGQGCRDGEKADAGCRQSSRQDERAAGTEPVGHSAHEGTGNDGRTRPHGKECAYGGDAETRGLA